MTKRQVLAIIGMIIMIFICLPGLGEEAGDEYFVKLSTNQMSIAAGEKKQLMLKYVRNVKEKKKTILWQSSDPETATVDDRGGVTGVKSGEAIVSCTVMLPDGRENTVSCLVSVHVAVAELQQESNVIYVIPGEKKEIPVTILPEGATNPGLEWVSKNYGVASVDENGWVTGINSGKTQVSATTTDGSRKKLVWDVIVPTVFAENNTYVIDESGKVQIPITFSGADFDAGYAVETTGSEIFYDKEIIGNQAIFTVTATTAGDAHLIIRDRRNPVNCADVMIIVANDAFPNAKLLEITSADILQGMPVLTYKFELVNRSASEIGEIGFLVDYRDQFGDTHYLLSNTDGTIQNHQYTTMINILPGETGTVYGQNEVFRTNDMIKEVRLAIYYYRYLSGQKVYIPDSQLHWYSTKTGVMPRPELHENYVQPDEDTLDRAMRINLGAGQCTLYSYTVKEFSRSKRPGVYLAYVNENGYAASWGLKPGDVIYGADDILWADDPFMLNRALCDVYDGKTVTLKVVRNGEEIEVPITKEAKQE